MLEVPPPFEVSPDLLQAKRRFVMPACAGIQVLLGEAEWPPGFRRSPE
jgi:hypothetical protein